MATLAQLHCLNHSEREAVAQCPECHLYFCRECIVEHDDRILCGACLRKLSTAKTALWRPGRGMKEAAWTFVGFLTALLFFYWAGQLLLMTPAKFHDGTLWKSAQGEE